MMVLPPGGVGGCKNNSADDELILCAFSMNDRIFLFFCHIEKRG